MNQHNQTRVKVEKAGCQYELKVNGRVIATASDLDELEEHAEYLDSIFDEVGADAYDEGQSDCEECDDCEDAYDNGREDGVREGESNCEECPETEK